MPSKNSQLPVIEPNLQISFYIRLQTFRDSYLSEALASTISQLKVPKIDKELGKLVSSNNLSKLASFGLRGEIMFPVPCVIRARPSLLGYYRLLFGLSQKEFYRSGGMAGFKCLEERNEIPARLSERVDELCESLILTAGHLLEAMTEVDMRTIQDLQLLTVGAQFRGGQNTKVGKEAAEEVFSIIERHVRADLIEESPQELILKNAAGRKIVVAFSSDPDISVTEIMGTGTRLILSIEIKGGADVSNIHNRIGEAEKSHQKAKSSGYFEFWTIIGAEINLEMAHKESPTTSRFFHLSKLRKPNSTEYKRFKDLFQSVVGIKTS